MSSSPSRATAVVVALFIGGAVAGATVGAAAAARATDPYDGLDIFARVRHTILEQYVDPLDAQGLTEAAVRGMVEQLDEHSHWMTAEEYETFQEDTQGSYEGIGIEVRKDPRGALVARVMEGGPALRDGLQVGDVLLKANGVSLDGMALDEIARVLKGPRGSSVSLEVQRDDQVLSVTTVRDRIVTQAIVAERLDSGVGYVRLEQFQQRVGRDLQRQIDDLGAEGKLTGLVLDLRDNPGGLLTEAVAVSDIFLDDGMIVSTRSRIDGEEVYTATVGGVDPNLPVVVLVNGLSASASEIVAAALQERGRATLVGTHTYGKGSVQTIYENRDRSALRMTIGRYYTPSGEPVAPKEGRVPDHVVEFPGQGSSLEQIRQRLDGLAMSTKQRAEIEALLGELEDNPPREPLVPRQGTIQERRLSDPQLDYALELLE